MAIRDSYDYIVVGGGSSGAAVAARLSENPDVTVALLEAGPDDRKYDEVLSLKRWPELLESGLDWDYPIEEQENGNSFMRHARAKVLGGCSSHNSCIAFHTPAEDLEIWEKLGANDWTPENVLPLIKKLETNSREGDQYGHDGPVEIMDVPQVDPVGTAVLDACEEAGLPRKQFNTGETVKHGAGFFQINSHQDNTRSSSAVSYLHPNEKRENLDILTDMWVTRILFADDTNTATGVEYLADSFNRKATISANKEVIISAGAINTPQLLMLSGIGPREHLEEFNIDVRVDAPGVGSNLQDHPEAVIQFESKVPMVRDSTQWWEIGIFTQIDDDTDLPDLMMHYGCTPFDMHTARQGYPQADEAFALTPNVCHARSRGTVRLRSNDYRDKPKVDPRYFTDEEGYDMRIAVEGIKLARKIAGQPALKDIVARELSPGANVQTDEEIADYISTTHNTVYHPVGTVRMGSDDDEMSPLDPELRVKGTKNLRVADASVMPQIVAINPNITCYVIGERAAQLIAGEA